ncbi:hypothetical protein E2C01_097044 [Portunus trituberculatus]|uniref:Uncharacterized protein n=1 Tax=Portunus trituberculatus TaxID=210409 RepID=A0A5B7JX89_PORTR|nr:hypothetical protein [Portunus trituberculatus]
MALRGAVCPSHAPLICQVTVIIIMSTTLIFSPPSRYTRHSACLPRALIAHCGTFQSYQRLAWNTKTHQTLETSPTSHTPRWAS